jgi:hypothetical protein
MGMSMSVFAVSAGDLGRILADPPLAHSLVDCEPGSRAAAALPRRACDLDRSFMAVSYVLVGGYEPKRPTPLAFLFGGGVPLGIDSGLGQVRTLDAAAVAELAAALAPIDEAAFAARIDHAALLADGVYAMTDDEAEDRAYVLSAYLELRELVLDASRHGEALVIW